MITIPLYSIPVCAYRKYEHENIKNIANGFHAGINGLILQFCNCIVMRTSHPEVCEVHGYTLDKEWYG